MGAAEKEEHGVFQNLTIWLKKNFDHRQALLYQAPDGNGVTHFCKGF